jgi:hypothetical protein
MGDSFFGEFICDAWAPSFRRCGAAIVAAVADYNHRQRVAALVRHLGTCKDLMTVEELVELRKRG